MNKYTPLVAAPHTPPYKIHKYFARRPWNVFSQLIQLYSDKNSIVLDPFMGGGVTILESLKLERNVIGFDLNPLSKFIVSNMLKSDDTNEIEKTANNLFEYIHELYSEFDYIQINSKKHKILWSELAFMVYCNHCNARTSLSNTNKVSNGKYRCENINCPTNTSSEHIQPKNCKRDGYEYLFAVIKDDKEFKKRKHIKYDGIVLRKLKEHILFLKGLIEGLNLEVPQNKIPLNWDRQYEDLLEKKNIKFFEDLFTKRNLYLNLLLKAKIDEIRDENIRSIFRLVFSSSLRDSNIMAFTNEDWQSGSPTTWSKHAYWIPSQFCEVSVQDAFERAYSRMRASINYNRSINLKANKKEQFQDLLKSRNSFLLFSDSISDISIPEDSIDAIITDPPYGSNVQYLELSHFWYVWNKDIYKKSKINFDKEAISNRKKNFEGCKNTKVYFENLLLVFSKCYSVLKPNRYMVLTFNNKDIGSWLAIIAAIIKAGFSFNDMFFQDGVKNYKQTAHTKYEGSPYGDFIYLFSKDANKNFKPFPVDDHNEISFIEDINSILKEDNLIVNKKSNIQIIDMFKRIIPLVNNYIANNGVITEKTFSYFHKKKLENV